MTASLWPSAMGFFAVCSPAGSGAPGFAYYQRIFIGTWQGRDLLFSRCFEAEVFSLQAGKKAVLGWIGVGTTVVFAGLWAYWGAFENFHEGWYSPSIWENIGMLLFQYMLLALVFVLLAVVALRWKRGGLLLHLALGVLALWFFSDASFFVIGVMVVIPIFLLGLLYYYGEPRPKIWAYRLIIGVPLVIVLAISIPSGIRVAQRLNDGDFGLRIVAGNGVTLAWAPRGPGWPDQGTTWYEAQTICRFLAEDGVTVMAEEQNIWRLPTVDEAVRSMMRQGENAGGLWDQNTERAVYARTPDKETPLWDLHSKVIYYWTADTPRDDLQQAYMIVYHGGVFRRNKQDGQDYLSFRAVKTVAELP